MGFLTNLFRKSQASLFGDEVATKLAQQTRPTHLHVARKPKGGIDFGLLNASKIKGEAKAIVGQIKQRDDGTSLIFLETTIGAPRWHTFKEANELAKEGKLTPASRAAVNNESRKHITSSRSAVIGELPQDEKPAEPKPEKKDAAPEQQEDSLSAKVHKKVVEAKKTERKKTIPRYDEDLFSAKEPELKAESEPKAEPEHKAEPELKVEREPESKVEQEPEPKVESEPEPKAASETTEQDEPRDAEKPAEFGVSAEIIGLRKKREEWNRQAKAILGKKDHEITQEDKKILAKYSGDGGTTENSLNEFYTSKEVAAFQWKMMEKFGFNGGNVLEPSCATGVYIHTKPEDTLVTGVEISGTSAKIAEILHPHDDIRNMPFEQFVVDGEDNNFTGAIGNLPFGVRGESRAIDEPKITAHEDYFLTKLFEKVEGGGVLGFIMPTGVMDNAGKRDLRAQICEDGQFLAAYRLPNTAFKHSGTTVTTDMVFFKKHPRNVGWRIATLKQTPEGMKELEEAGIYDNDFISGKYFEKNENHLMGTKDTGNWGRTIVKGTLSQEHFDAALADALPAALDYSKITEHSTIEEKELHVGDTIYRNGHTYRLNDNHRWERADIADEEARQRKLNVNWNDFGVPSKEEFHELVEDIARRSKISDKQRQRVADYLSVVAHEDLPEKDTLELIFREAIRASDSGATSADQDKLFTAAILGAEINALKVDLESGHDPDYRRFEQMILLLDEYKAKYGNPSSDKQILKNTRENAALSFLTGAFREDGELSDMMKSPQDFVKREKTLQKEYNDKSLHSILNYFNNQQIQGTVDRIARFYGGAAGLKDDDLEAVLLADEAVGFDKGEYTTIEKATTGSVYDKLDRWEEELKRVQASKEPHAELKAAKIQHQIDLLKSKANFRKVEDMPIMFTSRFIDTKYLNEFLQEKGQHELIYDADTNTYNVNYDSEGEKLNTHSLLTDTVNHMNNVDLAHGVNNEKAREAVKEFEAQYKQWLFIHKDRDSFEDSFNRKFNNYVTEVFDNTPIPIDKMKDGFDLNLYHYSAIRRLLAKGRGILAYGTGVGKTYAGIAYALLQKQTGQAKKPMIIAPKSVLANWRSEIGKLTEGKDVKVMVIGVHEKKDKFGNTMKGLNGKPVMQSDSPEEVLKKMQMVSQNDYDLVLCSYDKSKMMMLSDERFGEYIRDISGKHLKDEEKNEKRTKDGKTKSKYLEAYEKYKASLSVRGKRGGTKIDLVSFEQMGIDSLIIDEAHNFKNLFGLMGRYQKAAGVMAQPDTQRSVAMYALSRYVREQNNGKNVTLLTATPTVNNPLETFNMLQYIAPEEFEKRGIYNMQSFFDIFGKITKDKHYKPDNTVEDKDTLTGFQALPELRQLFFEYTDMRTAADVGLKIPKPAEKHNLSTMTPVQRRVYNELRTRALEFSKMSAEEKEESGDHIFTILSDMKKATISLDLLQRTGSHYKPVMINDEVSGEGMSAKMRDCVTNSLATFRAGEKKLIFCEFKEAQDELLNYMVNAGIPKEKIFVFNATTVPDSDERQQVAEDYNDGKYAIIIGNKSMSEGMNFQVETAEIDHLDIPFTPAEITQRNGRGVRQGNKKGEVRINYYLTTGSLDASLNAIMQRKKNWQWELWHSDTDTAQNENTGQSFSPEEMQIMLSDNPEAERLAVEAMKQTAIQRQVQQYKSRALSTFNQMQNMMAQYGKMSPEERQSERGETVATKIQQSRNSLLKDKHFEHKDVLESTQPVYVDPEKQTLMPAGHHFTKHTGDWKKDGLFKLVSVDPVNRKVVIQRVDVAQGESGRGYYDNRALPSECGVTSTLGYKDLRGHFEYGMKPVSVSNEEISKSILENLKSLRHVAMLDSQTIANNKAEIIEKLFEGDKHLPYIDRKTGEVSVAEISDFHIPEHEIQYAEKEKAKGEINGFWTREVEKSKANLKSKDDIYLPVDPIRWRTDILNRALDDAKEREAYNKKHTYKSRGKTVGGKERSEFEILAGELYGGWDWKHNLPSDFVRVEPPEFEENEIPSDEKLKKHTTAQLEKWLKDNEHNRETQVRSPRGYGYEDVANKTHQRLDLHLKSRPDSKTYVAPVETPLEAATGDGKRYRYGMQLRPLDIGTAPKGYIPETFQVTKEHPHGEVDYDRPLTPEEVRHFSLTDFTTRDKGRSERAKVEEMISGVSTPEELEVVRGHLLDGDHGIRESLGEKEWFDLQNVFVNKEEELNAQGARQ